MQKEVATDSPSPGQELTESFTRIFLNEHRESLSTSGKERTLEFEYKIEMKTVKYGAGTFENRGSST